MDKAKRIMAQQGLRQFLEIVTISSRPEPRPFKEIADPWQWDKVLDPLIPAIEHVSGLTKAKPQWTEFWLTLPKGSDKTSVVARTGHWICNFAPRHTAMCVWASDKKQAKLLRDAMSDEKKINPWFPDEEYVIDNYKATGVTGFVEINSTDVSGGHGTRGQIYVADEVTVWKDKRTYDMIHSSYGKYEDSILIVLGNAGWKDTWQHKLRNEFEKDYLEGGKTYFWEPHGIQASWTDRHKIESIRRKISPSEGRRLYDNEWVEGTEDPAFPAELVNEMFSMTDFVDTEWPIPEWCVDA